MKLTKAQRNVLQRMKDGEVLLSQRGRVPYQYEFCNDSELTECTRVSSAVVRTLCDHGCIRVGDRKGVFSVQMLLTEKGEWFLKPAIPESSDFRSDLRLRVTESITAVRNLQGLLHTRILYLNPQSGIETEWA